MKICLIKWNCIQHYDKFFYDQMKKHHRKEDELSCKLNIIVTDGKKNKRISYEGPANSAEEALKLAVQGVFNNEGDE